MTLGFPLETDIYELYTNASNKGLNIFLTITNQNKNKKMVVGFYSATFNKAEQLRTIFL